MKEVKDRLIQYPRRFKLTLVEGETDVYELTPVTGTVQEEGTPINAELFDSISADIEAEKSAREAAVSAVELKADTHIARVDNPHSVTKSQIGLGNVDNTSDANKPISTAAQEVFDSIENNLNNLPDIYEKKENLSVTIDNVKLNEQFTLPEGVYDKIVNNKNFTLVCNFQNGECVKFSAWSKANFLGTDLLTSLSVLSLANMSSDVKDDSIGGHLISISKQSNLALAYIKQYLLVFDGGTFSDLTAGAAIADIDGNNIPNTYAKKTEIPDISNFAEKNGTYPEMAVGNATNAETANSANSAANAEDSAKLGGVAAANYALINGTYLDMVVGNANHADEATSAYTCDIANEATKATQDSNGDNIVNTYAKQTGLYPNMTAGKATHAAYAESANNSAKLGGVDSGNYAQIDGTYSEMTVGAATKATQDGNGDNIADTYQPKVEGVEMQYCGIELGDQSGTPSNAYIDFHVDGKPGDETDYNARIVAYSDFPKDLAVQLKDGGAFKVPSGQSFVPNGDSSEKATPTEFLQGATIFYNNNGSIGKLGYRGKSYNIILSSNFTTSGGGNINVTRSGNVIMISGWLRNTSVLNNGTSYILLTGLPRTVYESMGVAPYASLNGVSRAYIQPGGDTLYFTPSFIVEGSTIAANSWFSISLTYITNE